MNIIRKVLHLMIMALAAYMKVMKKNLAAVVVAFVTVAVAVMVVFTGGIAVSDPATELPPDEQVAAAGKSVQPASVANPGTGQGGRQGG